jgi:hypothetical protein
MKELIKFRCFLCDSQDETQYELNKIYNTYDIDKILYIDVDLLRHPKSYTVKIIFTIKEEKVNG